MLCSKFSVYNHTKKIFFHIVCESNDYSRWSVCWKQKTSCSLIHWWRWNKVSELFVNDVGIGPQSCGICYSVCAKTRKQTQTQTKTRLFGTNPIWRHSHINPLSFILLIAFSFLLKFRTPEEAAQKKVDRERKVFVTIQMWRKWENWQSRCGMWCFKGKPNPVCTREMVSRRLPNYVPVKWVFLERHIRVSGPVCVCIMVCEVFAKYLMKVKADKQWTWNLMNI